METKEYRTVDKASWGHGEWRDEPDKMQWPDGATGLPCLIVRGPSGALCGYVGVPDTHPWHGKGYDDAVGECTSECTKTEDYESHYSHSVNGRIDVHGGLTFASACAHTGDESKHICHVPGPGEPDNVWWFGFDCAHSGDLCPKYEHRMRFGDETYKDLAYVKGEVTKLARQLSDCGRG